MFGGKLALGRELKSVPRPEPELTDPGGDPLGDLILHSSSGSDHSPTPPPPPHTLRGCTCVLLGSQNEWEGL